VQENNATYSDKHTHKKPVPPSAKYLVVGGFIIISGGAGFLGGMQFQKAQNTSSAPGGLSQSGMMEPGQQSGGQMMGRMGTFGKVTAVTSSTITISIEQPMWQQDSSSDSSNSSTNSTTVTKDGESASISDVAVGDTVSVKASSSDSSAASSIRIGSLQQGQNGPSDSSSNSDSSSSNPST
jgi:hypothetical protein